MRCYRGLTLIELILYLLISSILLGVAVPSMFSLKSHIKANQTSRDIMHALNYARIHAVTSRHSTVVCPSKDKQECSGSWGDDWIIFEDKNSDTIFNESDILLRELKIISSEETLTWKSFGSRPFIKFDRNGTTGYQNGRLYYCGPKQIDKKQIIVYRSGRARYAKGKEIKNSCG